MDVLKLKKNVHTCAHVTQRMCCLMPVFCEVVIALRLSRLHHVEAWLFHTYNSIYCDNKRKLR